MDEISIVIDFTVNDDLIRLIEEASTCPYCGINDSLEAWDFNQARRMLSKVVETGKFAKYKRLGILKIYKGSTLVGFSFPRAVDLKEYEKFKLSVLKDYYRTGTIYVAKAYRRQGIAKIAVSQFKQQYKHILWTCRACNTSSKATATAVGLLFRHQLYFDDAGAWHFNEVKKTIAINHVYY